MVCAMPVASASSACVRLRRARSARIVAPT
nr:MAG TPA: hypothetical protein [Caudoviricetes sp.]